MAATLSAGAWTVAVFTQVRGLKDLHSHQDTIFWTRWGADQEELYKEG